MFQFVTVENGYNWNDPRSRLRPLIFWSPRNLVPKKFGSHEIWSLHENHYSKVVSSRLSQLVAHLRIFRLFMKGKFDAYVLWPLAKRVQNWIVDRSTARDFTVYGIFLQGPSFFGLKFFRDQISWRPKKWGA